MKRLKQMKRSQIAALLLMAVFFAVFCVSSVMLVTQIAQDRKEARAFEDLAEQLGPDTPPEVFRPAQDAEGNETEPAEDPGPFIRYDVLHEQNPDMIGWVCIEGTEINYPVMYTPDDPEHYLHRGFDGSYAASGVPFLDAKCFDGCGNALIYGHHMKNGSMFASLTKYAKEDFYRQHPVIRFDTLTEPAEYDILAAFYSKVYTVEDTGVFRYYYYTDLSEQETFEEYLRQVYAASLYDTGVTAEYGDQLLTLTTCSYNTKNGRFVVVAKKR